MTNEAIDLVVFDMAGTTIEATDQVPDAFRQAMGQAGSGVSDSDISGVRGRSKRQAITELLTVSLGAEAAMEKSEEVYAWFQDDLVKRYRSGGVAEIPGAGKVFAQLRSRGIKVALSTGFDRVVAQLLVEMLDWQDAVDVMVCNEDVSRGRPAPYLIYQAMETTGCDNVHRVMVVGDTVSDLQAADHAGVGWAVGVLSGAHSEGQLKQWPHSIILESVRDLVRQLQNIIANNHGQTTS